MKKKFLILLALSTLVAITGFAPAQASVPLPFGILNMTFDKVYVTLEGQNIDKDYYLEAVPGENEFTVLQGMYKYSYESCWTFANGTEYKGDIQVKGDNTVLTIDPCPGQPVPTKLAIYSHYEDTVTVTFYGPLEHEPDEFTVDVDLGKTRYDAWSGTYQYSFDACDQTFTGELYVTKNGKTKFYLKSCATKTVYDIYEEMADTGSNTGTAAAKFRVANNFTSSVTVTLIGAHSYLLDVDPGLNRFYNIEPGTYTYIFGYEGVRYEGVITVGDNGETIFAIPYPVFAEGE